MSEPDDTEWQPAKATWVTLTSSAPGCGCSAVTQGKATSHQTSSPEGIFITKRVQFLWSCIIQDLIEPRGDEGPIPPMLPSDSSILTLYIPSFGQYFCSLMLASSIQALQCCLDSWRYLQRHDRLSTSFVNKTKKLITQPLQAFSSLHEKTITNMIWTNQKLPLIRTTGVSTRFHVNTSLSPNLPDWN